MSRRRFIILSIGALAVVCIGLGILAMLPPRPGVTKANFDRIEKGMTQSEVNDIFGKSASRHAGFCSASGNTSFEDWLSEGGSSASLTLHNDIVVGFQWNESTETIVDIIRRWFGGPVR